MERRVAASEKMLQEIHSVVLELRRTAAAVIADSSAIRRPVAHDLATSSSAAAFGSAAQMAASAAIDRGAAMPVQQPVMLDAVVQEPPGRKLLNCVRQVIGSQCPCRGTRRISSNPALLPSSHSMPVSLMRFGQRFGRENSLTSPSYLSRH